MNYQSKAITKVLILEIIFIFLSSLGKFIVGLFINSAAMISDAVHTLTEAISTIMVIIGVKLSQKEEDEEYHYGYDKIESVISIILACVIFAAALSLFSIGTNNFVNAEKINLNLFQQFFTLGLRFFLLFLKSSLLDIIKEWENI